MLSESYLFVSCLQYNSQGSALQLQQLGGQRVSDVPRQRLSTPPLDLPVATHPPVEDIIQETAYSERQYSMPRDSEVEPVKSVKEKETVEYDRMPTEPMSPMSHSPGEVLTDDEEVCRFVEIKVSFWKNQRTTYR